MKANRVKGYFCVMTAAVLWASSGTAGKALFRTGVMPLELVQIRVTLSAILLLIVLGVFKKQLLRIRLRDVVYFFLLGSIVMTLAQLSYFYAISEINVAAAILLQYLAPILIALYAISFWQERVTRIKIASLCLAAAGCYLVVGGYNLKILQMNHTGILWGLTSAVSFAAYTLLGERGMHRYSPWTVLLYVFASATLSLNIIYHPMYLEMDYGLHQWPWLLYISIIGTLIPFGLYFVGVSQLRSTRTSITATLEPISAAFMAFFALGEAFEIIQIVGGILVIGSIILLQLEGEEDNLAPELIRNRHVKATAVN